MKYAAGKRAGSVFFVYSESKIALPRRTILFAFHQYFFQHISHSDSIVSIADRK